MAKSRSIERTAAWINESLSVTHHEAQVIEAVEHQFALVLREAHVFQPLPHRLLQHAAPRRRICRQRMTLEQRETIEPIAAALGGRDVALPHHLGPAELRTAATTARQCPGLQRGPWLTARPSRINTNDGETSTRLNAGTEVDLGW